MWDYVAVFDGRVLSGYSVVGLILYVFMIYRGGFFIIVVDFWVKARYDGGRSE